MRQCFALAAVGLCLTAVPARAADEVVCPSTDPFMKDICGAAEHSAKMFAALQAGDFVTVDREAQLGAADLSTFGNFLNYLALRIQAELASK